MDTVVRLSGSRSCPALRYRDVNFAASWLCTAFGFERHSTIEDDDKRINYAELSFGNTIIMLGAIGGFEVDNLMKQPDEIGGAETQCSYFIVDDLDAHYARARDAGAKIVLEIKTHLNGARGYACADPEGHLWNFGTYDTHRRVNEVKEATGTTGPSPLDTSPLLRLGLPTESRSSPSSLRRVAVGVGISAIGLILASVSVAPWQRVRQAVAAPASLVDASRINVRATHRLLAFERTARRIAERRSGAMREEVARERTLRVAAEQATRELDRQLSNARRAKDLAVSAMIAARQEVSRPTVQAAKEDAQRFATKLKARLSEAQLVSSAVTPVAPEANSVARAAEAVDEAQAARAAAELATKETREQLAQERSSHLAALRKIEQLKKRLAMVESNLQRTQSVQNGNAPVKSSKGNQQRPINEKATPPPTDGWNLSHGPVFQ